MTKIPIRGELIPRGLVGEPLAGFSTNNLRDAVLNKAIQDLETRSFGTANLRNALQAAGRQTTSQQSPKQSEQSKPRDVGKN